MIYGAFEVMGVGFTENDYERKFVEWWGNPLDESVPEK